MIGSVALVKLLESYDVEYVFGVPGDTSIALYDALAQSASIRHVVCRDERSAGYMADVYARLSGKPGVTDAPSGGGAAYLFPAVSEADGSSVPLIAITSDIRLSSENKTALTELDQVSTFRHVSRFSTRVVQPDSLPHAVRMAFRAATGGRMGAAHLCLPEDILSMPLSADGLHAQTECARYPAWRPRPGSQELLEIAALLSRARKPLLLAGGGVLLSQASDQLIELAERLGIGVVTSMDGKGSINETHELSLGVVGANGGKRSSNDALRGSDLVIAVGTKLNSTTTIGGKLLSHSPCLVHADIDPLKLGNTCRTDLALLCDARRFLGDLKEAIAPVRSSAEWMDWVKGARRNVVKEGARAHMDAADCCDGHLHPLRIIKVLASTLPPRTAMICDAGTATPYVMAYYPVRSPGKWVVTGRTHGSLGYALPGALGARMALPDCPVVALVGDGSLGMSIGEIETMKRLGARQLIILHFRNDCYGWIKMLQKLYRDERYFGVDFDKGTDYVAAARALGSAAESVGTSEELKTAIERALERDVSFIEARVPSETEITPPVAPWIEDERLPAARRSHRSY